MASPGDPKPQSSGPELSKPAAEPANETQERPSFLASSEPIREDQVQNAVNFLSHPKVRGSPVIYRRSFLEKKGLTKDEIDEAFHRVPDPASNATPVTSNQVAQPNLPNSVQPQAHIQSPQSIGVPGGAAAMVPAVQQPRFLWSHAFIAAGVLAASGAGTAIFFKKIAIPKLKTWIRKVVAEEKESEKQDEQSSVLAEQTAEAAKAAAAAAAVVAKASEELLSSKNEEKKYFEAFMNMMDVQVKEMKSMGEAIRKLESKREHNNSPDKSVEEYIRSMGNGTTNNPSWRAPQVNQSNLNHSSIMEQLRVNGNTYADNAEVVRPSSTPTAVGSAVNPKSYAEIRNMVQRVDERPPYIKPWEVPSQKPSYSEVVVSNTEENGKSQDYPSEPSWRNKSVKITEIEAEPDQHKAGGFSQRGWVPPQPPGVAIPESAAAIRQPKSSTVLQKQQSNEIVGSSDGEVISEASFNSFNTRNEAGGSSSVSEIEEVREVEC